MGPLRSAAGDVVGVLVRQQQAITGAVEVKAQAAADGLFKITLRVMNLTPFEAAAQRTRDEALLQSFVSTHSILSVRNGEFISLLDPPEQFAHTAAGCCNVGTYPVLVGEAGERDMILSSPIILYDYPQIAPESAGDMFDGTEIDEILTLRILTLTDEEKQEARQTDERACELLDRTEALSGEQLMKLHGVMRNPRLMEEP
jgi:hydrogenase maturation protease